MRPRRLPLLALALLALPFALAAPSLTQGPYAGALVQGQAMAHLYDDHPPEGCPDWFAPVWYTVTLRYQPPTDALTLHVEGHGSALGAHGYASISWEGDGCQAFVLAVEGTRVATIAAYEAHVARGEPPAAVG